MSAIQATGTGTATEQTPRKRHLTDRAKAERRLAYMLIAPAVIVMVLVAIWPIINTFIGSLVLSGVSISGSVTQAEVQNISVPIIISGINLKTISIGAIDVNNITL